jgi:hypothetical protein
MIESGMDRNHQKGYNDTEMQAKEKDTQLYTQINRKRRRKGKWNITFSTKIEMYHEPEENRKKPS